MKKISSLMFCLLLFTAACSVTPLPTEPPRTAASSAPTAISLGNSTLNVSATETAIAQRIFTTLTASAPQAPTNLSTQIKTVTPPPLPQMTTNAPTSPNPSTPQIPTLSSELSPSVTPLPQLPTRPPTRTPQATATATPLVFSRDTLRGKILFKSTRAGGKFPNNYKWFAMNGDGTQVEQVPTDAAKALYQSLKGREGLSPDASQLVVGEATCGSNAHCDLYIGAPEVVINRSQGQWTPTGQRWYRADNPVWSPQGDWVAFIWNRDNNRTKNVFKGNPYELNQDFKRLTDFGGGRDTKELTYSPDGAVLAFATQDGPRWQIWTLNALADNPNDAAAHNLSNAAADEWDPLWIK